MDSLLCVVYSGLSMSPLLQEGDLMEIRPYQKRPPRVGDVILFGNRENQPMVVHRVVRTFPERIITRGDHNPGEDPALPHSQIVGQVVAFWRLGRRQRVYGGPLAGLGYSWRNLALWMDRRISGWLRPVYHALARDAALARWLPPRLRPRVFHFRTENGASLVIVWGKWVIAYYDQRRRTWMIRRPFRLFIEGRLLAILPPD